MNITDTCTNPNQITMKEPSSIIILNTISKKPKITSFAIELIQKLN